MSPGNRDQSVRALLDRFRRHNRVPAVGAAIAESDGRRVIQVLGSRRRGSDDSVKPSDQWHIGSCTKSITAALWARLVELGQAEWDITLYQIFKDLSGIDPGWKDITIRNALHCRAGMPSNIGFIAMAKSWEDTRPLSEQRTDIAETTLKRRPAKPGKYVYSNLSYIIMGAAIDRIAGTTYEEALENHILEPLGVESAGFGAPPDILGHPSMIRIGMIEAFRGRPMAPDNMKSDNPLVFSSAGTLHLSLEDWARLHRIFLTEPNGSVLLCEESITELLALPKGPGLGMAMGWIKPVSYKNISYYMQGSNTLWSATSALSDDRGKCVLLACNDGRTKILDRSLGLAWQLMAL